MVRELILFSLVAFAAVGMLTAMLAYEAKTGAYVFSGGGKNWYYGAVRAQMEPDEACIYAGCSPIYPKNVFSNDYGTVLSLCNCDGQQVGIPLTQTVFVPGPDYPPYP